MKEHPWPFLASEALAAKTMPERAMRALHEPIYPGVYAPAGIELTASQRAHAAWLWSRRKAAVAGNSAAALLGAKWISPALDAELVHDNRRPPGGITVHTDTLGPHEVLTVGGVAVTTPARTAFDIGRRTVSRLQAVQRRDALTNATDVKVSDIEAIAAEKAGARGVVRLRRVLPLVDGGSESAQETRTRLVLLDAGFPVPRTQIPVVVPGGHLIARIDMGWEEFLVGVEYDGAQHWTDPMQRNRDIDRHAELFEIGWTIIRVSGDMLRYRQGTLTHRVGSALTAAGWRP